MEGGKTHLFVAFNSPEEVSGSVYLLFTPCPLGMLRNSCAHLLLSFHFSHKKRSSDWSEVSS